VSAPLESTMQDVRYAVRMLMRTPGFTFFAVLTIALCLGANAAIFTLVDGMLLKGAGYPEPERIVQIWERPPGGGRNGVAAANYIDWAAQSQSFEAIAARSGATMSYTGIAPKLDASSASTPADSTASGGAGEARSLRIGVVSAPFFDVFGVRAAAGRTFARDEDRPGKEKVAVLTHRAWTNLFGADASLLHRDILLNGERYTVIGILPGNSEFDRQPPDIWVPLAFPTNAARDYHYLGVTARLKRGVTLEQAQGEMRSIAGRIAELHPAQKKGWSAIVDRMIDRLVGDRQRTLLIMLMSTVVAVLLIGCANLANLLMARATLRSREIALRVALGAGRRRIVRMLLTESLLLSVCGAIAGIGLGYALINWILALMPPFSFPSEADIRMDGRVLLFLAAAAVLTGVAFGLMPALQASRGDVNESLKEGGRASSASRGSVRLRHAFVIAQVALAFIFLVGGGLLIRSFQRAMAVDIGYRTEGIVAGYLPLKMDRNPEVIELTQYIQQLLDEVRAVPGMQAAAVTTGLPLRGWGDGMPMRLAASPDVERNTGFKIVSPDYFQALRLRLVAGRVLDERDTANAPPVVVVNESFVKRYFPGKTAIGERILVEKILPSRRGLGPMTSWEIVGVVADEKGRGLENAEDVGSYASFAQNPVVNLGIVARGGGDAAALIKSMQSAVQRVNRHQSIDRPMTVDEIKAQSMMGRRVATMLLAGFAMLAMLLACAGIYGVLSFVTARRTQELGIRAALGASRADLMRMVVGSGTTPVLIGIVIGLAGAMSLSRFIQALLFDTSPLDAINLITVSALFLSVALAACLVPAWRASRIDPATALRQE
jgi:putative ABC transport system permease protein